MHGVRQSSSMADTSDVGQRGEDTGPRPIAGHDSDITGPRGEHMSTVGLQRHAVHDGGAGNAGQDTARDDAVNRSQVHCGVGREECIKHLWLESRRLLVQIVTEGGHDRGAVLKESSDQRVPYLGRLGVISSACKSREVGSGVAHGACIIKVHAKRP
ncbi:hypothetical protein H257_09704 [Aphanomyces astaci]|uniref:Uncharacterized protein n=1 Tax=Aphanomyces astaci TaxID=112090 RepID=W4G947_APHAT|nr:hypothetical protein H257_09704 [Aphanomyces astaci]ETV76195.1 hypothetical protein H257_09704 [Aphanomyces astaci]|eukprot:XP_009834320.1 hypothetical protein H257_09704 [Aphanomyces astaci]